MSIITDVQLVLNDAGVFWDTTQVLDAINQAQLELFARIKWLRTSATLSLVIGQEFVGIPSTILIPSWIEGPAVSKGGEVNPKRVFPSTQYELESFNRLWRGAELDEPRNFVLWDATTLRVFPRPDQSYSYTIWGIGMPTAMGVGDTLTGPTAYVTAVIDYSVGLLLSATRPELAQVYINNAEENVQSLIVNKRNNQSHNIRRLRPGKRFDLSQSGNLRNNGGYQSNVAWWGQ